MIDVNLWMEYYNFAIMVECFRKVLAILSTGGGKWI
jgi:hypothetical protein